MLRTGQSPAPSQGRSSSASTPGSRPTPGVLLPGTLASPRTGLAPAGCRELVARLRRGVLLSVVLGARAAGRTFQRDHLWRRARGRPAWLRPPPGPAWDRRVAATTADPRPGAGAFPSRREGAVPADGPGVSPHRPTAGQYSEAAQPPRPAAQPALAWRMTAAQTYLVPSPEAA